MISEWDVTHPPPLPSLFKWFKKVYSMIIHNNNSSNNNNNGDHDLICQLSPQVVAVVATNFIAWWLNTDDRRSPRIFFWGGSQTRRDYMAPRLRLRCGHMAFLHVQAITEAVPPIRKQIKTKKMKTSIPIKKRNLVAIRKPLRGPSALTKKILVWTRSSSIDSHAIARLDTLNGSLPCVGKQWGAVTPDLSCNNPYSLRHLF